MISRRLLLAAPALLPALSARADARPVTLVVPFPPGGGVDALARAVGERLAPRLGAPVIIDNRPGGSTSLAAGLVARAEPDGRSLLIGTPALSINPVLQPALPPGDPRGALVAIGRIATLPYVLHVGPSGRDFATLADLIAWGRAHPDRLDFANSGTATATHLSAALLAHRAGISVTHVPYRGGAQAALDIAAGRVHGMFQHAIEALPLLRGRETRALAVSTAERSSVLPEVPAVAETIAGFDTGSWNGLFAPRGTPPAIVARLNAALNEALTDPTLATIFTPQATRFIPGTPEALGELLDSEIRGWAALATATGIRAES